MEEAVRPLRYLLGHARSFSSLLTFFFSFLSRVQLSRRKFFERKIKIKCKIVRANESRTWYRLDVTLLND